MDVQNHLGEFENVSARLLGTLSNLRYGKDTITNYRRILKRVGTYMSQHGYSIYSEDIGSRFLEEQLNKRLLSASYSRSLRSVIRRLNDECYETQYIRRHTGGCEKPPPQWSAILADYLLLCKQKGNHDNTIKNKYHFCARFLNILSDLGLQNLSNINASTTVHACLRLTNKGAYIEIRCFLVYLYEAGLVCSDVSKIVPHYVRPYKLPSVYSVDEIRRLESAIDQSSTAGIRNYAIILLASRMGMRSGDIVGLRFNNLDFKYDRIHFIQQKTGNEQEYPMIPEVKFALLNYLKSARPSDDSDVVFLSAVSPYTPISTSAIRAMLKNAFIAADIPILGKKHGAHSLRASLASSLVNDDVPYEAVRKILGHTDPRAITHYAKIDLENLRLYALPAPSPTGNFKTYLYGGQQNECV